MSNLFICLTPLQLKIAKSLIGHGLEDKGDLLIIKLSSNELYNYYLKEFESFFKKITILLPYPKFPIAERYQLIKSPTSKAYKKVFVASLDNRFVHLVLSSITFNDLVTYDDGSANINPESDFFIEQKTLKFYLKNLSYLILGNRYSLKKIKKNSIKHYSIFRDVKNILNNSYYVNLFPANETYGGGKKHCKYVGLVILGTVFSEALSKGADIQNFLESVIKKVKDLHSFYKPIIYYIPHPREDIQELYGTKKTKIKGLAEDQILELLKNNEKICLIGFASTTQFIFQGNSRVLNIVLSSPFMVNKQHKLNQLLISLGANSIEV